MLHFKWDEEKDWANYLKHRVRFIDAQIIWFNESALEYFDEYHSEFESRFIRLGLHPLLGLLVVIFTETDGDQIRIISARKATKREKEQYERSIQS